MVKSNMFSKQFFNGYLIDQRFSPENPICWLRLQLIILTSIGIFTKLGT